MSISSGSSPPLPAPLSAATCALRSSRKATSSSARRRAGGLLSEIMPLLGVATWKAWSHPLELIELDTGSTPQPAFSLEPTQLRRGSSWSKSIHPPDRRKVRLFFDTRKPTQVGQSIDYRLIIGDGEPLWVRHWLLSRSRMHGDRWQLQGLLQAIPEQRRLERECLKVGERERNRIGHELHDDLCQVLTGLTCVMQVAGKRVAKLAPSVTNDIVGLTQELRSASNRVRAMTHGMFPAQLDYLTLYEALNEFVRQTKVLYPAKITVEFSGKLAPHSPSQILQLYRIAQEAVGNALRHGRATAIWIFVISDGHRMQVRVEDNGIGFQSTSLPSEGIGLHVMQYRARLLDGELRCSNLARCGSVVEVTYPLVPAPGKRSAFEP